MNLQDQDLEMARGFDEALKLTEKAMDESMAEQQEKVAWLALSEAPMWVYGRDALVGEYVEGHGWKKVAIWEPGWSRDDCIARGATHWWPHLRDLPRPAATKDKPK